MKYRVRFEGIDGEYEEKELRKIALQFNENDDPNFAEAWEEKIKKDEVKNVVEWLQSIGFEITEV